MIEGNQRKMWIHLESFIMIHEQVSLVYNLRQATCLEYISNSTKSIWKKPRHHLWEQAWISIDRLRLLIVPHCQNLLVACQVFYCNCFQGIDTLVGVLLSSDSMNYKWAFTSLCTLFLIIIILSSGLWIF